MVGSAFFTDEAAFAPFTAAPTAFTASCRAVAAGSASVTDAGVIFLFTTFFVVGLSPFLTSVSAFACRAVRVRVDAVSTGSFALVVGGVFATGVDDGTDVDFASGLSAAFLAALLATWPAGAGALATDCAAALPAAFGRAGVGGAFFASGVLRTGAAVFAGAGGFTGAAALTGAACFGVAGAFTVAFSGTEGILGAVFLATTLFVAGAALVVVTLDFPDVAGCLATGRPLDAPEVLATRLTPRFEEAGQ